MIEVTLDWEDPVEIRTILKDTAKMRGYGLYYITREMDEKEEDLYIGQTTYAYANRLQEHVDSWMRKYKGKRLVRLCKVVIKGQEGKPNVFMYKNESGYILKDMETLLIYSMRDKLVWNNKNTKSCNVSRQITITNTGNKGNLPDKICSTEM